MDIKNTGWVIRYDDAGFGGRKWTVDVGPIGTVGAMFPTKKAAIAACADAADRFDAFMKAAAKIKAGG